MLEAKDFSVTLTLRLTTTVEFAPIEREGPIEKSDAIDNAIGSIPPEVWSLLEGEGITIAYPIEGEAKEL